MGREGGEGRGVGGRRRGREERLRGGGRGGWEGRGGTHVSVFGRVHDEEQVAQPQNPSRS